jgi:hypothetical protein
MSKIIPVLAFRVSRQWAVLVFSCVAVLPRTQDRRFAENSLGESDPVIFRCNSESFLWVVTASMCLRFTVVVEGPCATSGIRTRNVTEVAIAVRVVPFFFLIRTMHFRIMNKRPTNASEKTNYHNSLLHVSELQRCHIQGVQYELILNSLQMAPLKRRNM